VLTSSVGGGVQAHPPKSVHLLKIRAKWPPILFDFMKWRPTFAEKHMKTFFGGHPKKGLHDLWGKKFAGKVAQNF